MIWIIAEGVLLILLLTLNIYVFRKRKGIANRKNMEELQNRETELERMLMNPVAGQIGAGGRQLRPYEEKYMSESKSISNSPGGVQVELIVRSPISEKKYFVTIQGQMTIGTAPTSELIIDSHSASGMECILSQKGNNLMFRNVNKGKVVAERNHTKKTLMDDESVRVHSSDRFYLEDTVVEIRFV